MRKLVIASVALSLVMCGVSCTAPLSREGETTSEALRSPDSEEAAFLTLINSYRTSQGLGALVATPLLNQIAYDHSLDMATNNYFDHNDLAGHTPFDRMATAGYQGGYEAENIAAGNATAAGTFDQWKNSAGHNANMLGTHYKAIGIGRAYAKGSTYGWYWTTDFGGVVDNSVNNADAGSDSAIDTGADTGTDSGVDAAKDAGVADTAPLPPPPPPGCTGPSETEPNNTSRAPNALGASVCGAITAGGDQDWYAWTATAGASYDMALTATGNAQIVAWQLVGGHYVQSANTSATEIKGTAATAGQFLIAVWSPTGVDQTYSLHR